jgi:spore coat polysaccharide biosynthesis protein SpsF
MNGIIIQARMTSKRFPGKSMALLAGKPMLQHVIERCKMVQGIDKIVVAVPYDNSDEMIYLSRDLGVDFHQGPEDDVLMRFYSAALFYKLTTIMRITADCPFIDPIVCSEVLAVLKAKELDYCCNCYPVRTYPKGLDCEVFTFDCLEAAHQLTKRKYDREHVTPFMQGYQGLKRVCVQQNIDISSENWCVDYPEDIPRLELMLAQAEARLVKSN